MAIVLTPAQKREYARKLLAEAAAEELVEKQLKALRNSSGLSVFLIDRGEPDPLFESANENERRRICRVAEVLLRERNRLPAAATSAEDCHIIEVLPDSSF